MPPAAAPRKGTAVGGFLYADIFFSCAGCCACWPGKIKTPPLRCGTALQQAMRRGGGVIRYNKSSLKRLVHRTCSRNYSCGPAETRALPCSLPSYGEVLDERLARSVFLFTQSLPRCPRGSEDGRINAGQRSGNFENRKCRIFLVGAVDSAAQNSVDDAAGIASGMRLPVPFQPVLTR